jgi:Aldehyde ferredoxin oxidoreductase, N-terminal domain
MEYLASDKIAVVDLSTRNITEDELDEDLVLDKIGGAGITKHLYDQYASDNPIVLGTGLLTGTLVPGASLGVITAKSPSTGKISHVPLNLDAGIELKYSGFDYIVIKGNADKPVYLWVHDGILDINDADDLWGKDTWDATDYIRNEMGDDLIQVLGIGQAGENGSDLAQIGINYWQSADRLGFGKLCGEKNLKLIAIRGMGLLEISEPEEFIEDCAELIATVRSNPTTQKQGLAAAATALGEEDLSDWLDPLTHRHMACFNTPVATNTFIFTDEDPGLLKETSVTEPGFLLTDSFPLVAFKKAGLSAKDAGIVLRACAKYGIDGAAVAELSAKSGITDPADIEKSFPNLKGPVESAGGSIFSPWAAVGRDINENWERRQAVAYILGLHPIWLQMATELTEEKLLDLAGLGTEMEFTPDTLDEVIDDILA